MKREFVLNLMTLGAPGEGNIDFSVLRELDYKEVFNLEVFSMDAVRTGKSVLSGLLF